MKHGFHISEIWCLDGAMYRAEDGYSIKPTATAYEVLCPDLPAEDILLDSERASMSQVSVTIVLPVEDVVGVVFGPEVR